MTVATNAVTVLAQAVELLRAGTRGDSAAAATLDAQLLLAHTLGTTRGRLLSHPELAVEAPAAQRYAALIAERGGKVMVECPDSLVELFRTNRYVGTDRVGDANQVSLGLTTRLLNALDGRQYLTATL